MLVGLDDRHEGAPAVLGSSRPGSGCRGRDSVCFSVVGGVCFFFAHYAMPRLKVVYVPDYRAETERMSKTTELILSRSLPGFQGYSGGGCAPCQAREL